MNRLSSGESALSGRCERLQDVGYLNLALSIFLLVGILVSYIPQHYRIIHRRTSEGISPYFVLLGTTSCTSAFANILVLSRTDVACCKEISAFECFAGLLGITQMGIQWFCFSIMLLLFLIFFPRNAPESEIPIDAQPTWRNAIMVALLCLVHGLVVILVTAVILMAKPEHSDEWAAALGVMATILGAIQYLPQIWTTYSQQDVGSLSIPMMVVQTPGSFLWAGSLAARLGPRGWSSWGSFLVTGSLQGCLLVMGIIFEFRKRKGEVATPRFLTNAREHIETDDEGSPFVENGSYERTPLLSADRKAPRSQVI